MKQLLTSASLVLHVARTFPARLEHRSLMFQSVNIDLPYASRVKQKCTATKQLRLRLHPFSLHEVKRCAPASPQPRIAPGTRVIIVNRDKSTQSTANCTRITKPKARYPQYRAIISSRALLSVASLAREEQFASSACLYHIPHGSDSRLERLEDAPGGMRLIRCMSFPSDVCTQGPSGVKTCACAKKHCVR